MNTNTPHVQRTANTTTHALTIGAIARQLGEPVHRIEYVVRSRGISPSSRAGAYRLFDPRDVDLIRAELRRIDADREVSL